MLVKFPYSASRRIFAESSAAVKKRTPEERAAARAGNGDDRTRPQATPIEERRTREQRAAKVAACTVVEHPRRTARLWSNPRLPNFSSHRSRPAQTVPGRPALGEKVKRRLNQAGHQKA